MKNRYPGKCGACNVAVPEGAGEALRNRDGHWEVFCAEHASGSFEVMTRAKRESVLAYDGSALATADAEVLAAPRRRSPLAAKVARSIGTDVPERSDDEAYTLMSGHPASPYQAAVFDHFRYGRGSRVVVAVAGAGKTTTMKNALRYLSPSDSVQMFAFNTDAAAQLKEAITELDALGERSYSQVRAGTFHSVGFRAVRRHLNLPDAAVRVDAGKCRRLLREHLCGPDEKNPDPEGLRTFQLYVSFSTQLTGLAKGEGIGSLVPDTDQAWWGLVDHHGLYLDSDAASEAQGIALARRLLARSNEASRGGWIDYDDQLYLVTLWGLRLYRCDVVICDEAQDVNPVRMAILNLSLRSGGRLYAVGDPRQAIYGFTGASCDAIDRIKRQFNAEELPLTVSYRCAPAIIERAQTWVPYIEAAPGAEGGLVEDDVPLARALSVLGPEDAMLCRQTSPLVTVAYSLIARGRAVCILGREIGEGLVNLIEQQKARGVDKLIEKIETWRDREAAKFIAKGDEGRAEGVQDRAECVIVLANTLPETERTVPALVARIRSMFVNPARGEKTQAVLTLATQHKAKGKEWDRVCILRPELNPSKSARQAWQEVQEYNLMYVAATRARQHLMYARAGDVAVEEVK